MSSLANTAIAKHGAGNDSVTAARRTAWTNLRVEGLAIDRYVGDDAASTSPARAELASATRWRSRAN